MRLLLACALVALSTFSSAQTCDTSPNSVGAGAILAYAPHVDPGLAAFTVTDAPPTKFGAILYSPNSMSPLPWGNGTLCVQPFVPGSGRMTVTQTGLDGSVVIEGVPLEVPGTYAQFIYRDQESGQFNLTNSIYCDSIASE